MSSHRYQLEHTEPEKLNIRLLYITKAQYGADWHSMIHAHHFAELFYIVKGTGRFRINDKTIQVKENDLIIINPNVPHTELGQQQNTPFEYITLGINGLQFLYGEQIHPYDYSLLDFAQNETEIRFYLQMLLKEVQNKEENFEAVCQNLLEILIFHLVRQSRQQLSFAPTKKATKECLFIEQYLDEHFSENISLETLSNLTFMNKYYLVHAFKNYKGKSPIKYLIEKRIAEAKHLLETTDYSIVKIAQAVGFSSQSYFSQTFRKETGISPNQYRKSKNAVL